MIFRFPAIINIAYQRVKKGEQVAVLPEPASGHLATFRYELLINGVPENPEKYLPKM